MKRLFFSIFLLSTLLISAQNRTDEWEAAEKAIAQKAPKTALKILKKIEKEATIEKAWGEAGKAYFLGLLQEHPNLRSPAAAQAAEAKSTTAHPQLKPLLRTLSASLLFSYYRNNHWQILSRTDLSNEKETDPETWGPDHLLREVDRRLQLALLEAEALKKLPAATFDGLLEEGTLSDNFRPTLYDFIAHEAAQFYALEETNGPLSQDTFAFDSESPALAPVAAFLAWQPNSDDSPKARALVLYQNLLRFHQKDDDQTAFLHSNLERLAWAHLAANRDPENKTYLTALRRFIALSEGHPNQAAAQIKLANKLQQNDETVEAHRLVSAAYQNNPKHPYGQVAREKKEQLEEKALTLQTHDHWANLDETIQVNHRNLDHVWFGLYSIPYPHDDTLTKRQFRNLLDGRVPVLTWDEKLENPTDYRNRQTQVTAPFEELPVGFHYLVASSTPDLTWKDEVVAYAPIHVTKLALTIRQGYPGGLDAFVVDAISGAPLPNIQVTATQKRNEKQKRVTKTTNAEGYASFPTFDQSTSVIAQQGLHRAVANTWVSSSHTPRDSYESLVFFTDRSIYRPGQVLHFKGIYGKANRGQGKYRALSNQTVTIHLLDPNRKKVATRTLVTNENGSVSGTFNIPKGRRLGRYHLKSEQVSGYKAIRVEEYKRPKFFSKILPPEDEAALKEKVTVTAQAEAYTGAAVDGAKVSWRIQRNARWPSWFRWSPWLQPSRSASAQIAQGMGETDAQGRFPISFVAEPDPSISPEEEPIFDYLVTVDITDATGETRSSSRTISVAYTTFRAEILCEDWLTTSEPVALSIRTSSHDEQPRAAKGTLKIYQLIEPESFVRPKGINNRFTNTDSRLASWELGKLVAEHPIETSLDDEAKGTAQLTQALPAGNYRVLFQADDHKGRVVQAFRILQINDLAEKTYRSKIPFTVTSPSYQVEVGDDLQILWGSGYQTARALVEVYQDQKLLHREWTPSGSTQHLFRFPVGEKQRGGFEVKVLQINQNRLHHFSRTIAVPWSNKALTLRWERIVNKLEPGAKETWTALIEGPDGEAAAAEMVATLYDASLDAFTPHSFANFRSFFRRNQSRYSRPTISGRVLRFQDYDDFPAPFSYRLRNPFRSFPKNQGFPQSWGYAFGGGGGSGGGGGFGNIPMAQRGSLEMDAVAGGSVDGLRSGDFAFSKSSIDSVLNNPARTKSGAPSAGEPAANDAPAPVRSNLQETAFFFPDLTSDADGKVRLSFTMPEALTTWRFLGFAHDKDLRAGTLTGQTITALDLMIQPNPPRFLREGDTLEFTAKVTNQSDQSQRGTATLQLANAATNEDRTAALGVTSPRLTFEVPANESRTVSWRLQVPDGEEFLRYKVTASSDTLSDGEEGWLPVLSRRVLVTESVALPIRGAGSKSFSFDKLLTSGASESLENRFLHLQVVSQPAWYGVMALPYLMEFPHECTEQTFSRYYANALGAKIINSDPKIKNIFELWKENGDTLDSLLTKNEDLEGILLEETPWLAQAENEGAARRRLALLFEDNKLAYEQEKALRKLQTMQLPSGLWPWFPGGRGNDYITLQITTGFARLRALEVATDITPALKALSAIDQNLVERYDRIANRNSLDQENLSPWVAHYLYTRSLFLKDKALDARTQVAFDYFARQANIHWATLSSRLSQAHVALALHRLDQEETSKIITRSFRETARNDEEQGMFWEDAPGWWWWQAPIETQALVIEAFREIDADEQAVNDCQVWLIKQKQVSDWGTTKATTEAVAALFLNGSQLLTSDALLEVKLGEQVVQPKKIEPGTGYYQERFVGKDVAPEQGQITLTKTDPGVSWASLHWQYLDTLENITSDAGNELQLEKELFVKRHTEQGPVLEKVTGPLAVGDQLVTRLILRNDRAMEFVHLKDQRGSGCEPMNVLSGYRWQDNLGYYETTRDTASHFFIDRLPAGTHVFETSVRIQHRGQYQTGLAKIRCMYAPEFAAHSDSLAIEVK